MHPSGPCRLPRCLLQAPPQPVKRTPAAGAAVKVTSAPVFSSALQALAPLPQLIPPPVTVPGPVTVTLSVGPPLSPCEKSAVTLFALVMVTVQAEDVPVHAPPQPSNVPPDAGVAVSVTVEPADALLAQVPPPALQSRPPPVTLPSPVTATLSGNVEPVPPVNLALTLFAASIVTEHVGEVPAHAPPQPLNPAPEPGVALSTTVESAVSSAVQPDPADEVHAISPPVTVPFPVTVTLSFSVSADFANVALTV